MDPKFFLNQITEAEDVVVISSHADKGAQTSEHHAPSLRLASSLHRIRERFNTSRPEAVAIDGDRHHLGVRRPQNFDQDLDVIFDNKG